MQSKFWTLPIFTDSRGSLSSVEFLDLPFKPKRIYFIYDVEGMRGGHAHKKEKEVFICLKGSFTGKIHDGKRFTSFKFNKPGQALYTANLVWHEFNDFSCDAVMLAISSTPYKGQKEYIMQLDDFINYVK